jgi:hypothetical protein
MSNHWTDRIVGDRMTVDQQFNDRVVNSEFSRQQWGLIMTAVEFEIEQPGDEQNARIVADTSSLPSVMSEIEAMESRGAMPGVGGDDSSSSSSSGGGIVGNLLDSLGFGGAGGGSSTASQLESAERLAQAYADELQEHLEQRGKWADVRAAAQN